MENKRKVIYWKPTVYIKNKRLLPNTGFIYPSSYLTVYQNAKLLEKYLKKYIKGKLIDLGCGTMPLYGFFKKFTTNWEGYDWISSDLPHIHQHNLGKKLPLRNGSANTVLMTEVLEHMENPLQILREANRIIAKNGFLIVTVPFLYCIHEEPHDYYRYTRFGLTSLAKKSGFKVELLVERGGIIESITEMVSALFIKIPMGARFTLLLQQVVARLVDGSIIGAISEKSKARFPTGYFMVLKKI